MEIVLATGNQKKAKEIIELLSAYDIEIFTRKDRNIFFEPKEDGETLYENAKIKAMAVYNITKGNVLSDDSGIFVRALNWEPGIHSSRFAGEDATDEENNQLLVKKIKNEKDRYAEYRAVIAFINEKGEIVFFEGVCGGHLIDTPRGNNGFGYDPYFIPKGYDLTFGELSDEIKNSISHRAKAFQKFLEYFKKEYGV